MGPFPPRFPHLLPRQSVELPCPARSGTGRPGPPAPRAEPAGRAGQGRPGGAAKRPARDPEEAAGPGPAAAALTLGVEGLGGVEVEVGAEQRDEVRGHRSSAARRGRGGGGSGAPGRAREQGAPAGLGGAGRGAARGQGQAGRPSAVASRRAGPGLTGIRRLPTARTAAPSADALRTRGPGAAEGGGADRGTASGLRMREQKGEGGFLAGIAPAPTRRRGEGRVGEERRPAHAHARGPLGEGDSGLPGRLRACAVRKPGGTKVRGLGEAGCPCPSGSSAPALWRRRSPAHSRRVTALPRGSPGCQGAKRSVCLGAMASCDPCIFQGQIRL